MGEASIEWGGVKTAKTNPTPIEHDNFTPIYDVNNVGVINKFVNSILHVNQFNGIIPDVDIEIFHKWRRQSEFKFRFVTLGSQILPIVESNDSKGLTPLEILPVVESNDSKGLTPLEMHSIIKATKKPNYMQARLPVNSQLKVDTWKRHLKGYWDIDTYIEEELRYDALLGPFEKHPISSGHCSPFMSRAKPNSERR